MTRASVDVRMSPDGKSISFLSWDTEGKGGAARSLLRANSLITVFAGSLAAKVFEDGFDLIVATEASAQLKFPFDPRVSAVTVLPAKIDVDAKFHLPAIVSAPGFGSMLVTASDDLKIVSTLDGSRAAKTIDWTIEIPKGGATLRFRPYFVPPPKGLNDNTRWKLARRAWLNQFEVSSRWGDAGNPYSAPAGVLANNVISDPVSCCLFIYADAALLTPELAPGISSMSYVSRTLDFWLKRMNPTGEVPGYWAYNNFLDANPSILISAWDYVEAKGDKKWLTERIEKLEKAGEFLASRDVDNDGLIEATQSGNPNTLVQPARSCSMYDAINCGHKDAYCNAQTYRAFRCMADLESQLGRADQQKRYTDLATRLKSAYRKTLFNDKTGWLAWWRDAQGNLHDLAAPSINGIAIAYDLIDPEEGRAILKKFQQKMIDAKFTRFDLGLPITLVPVARADYLLPDAPGLGKKDDGSDAFGLYLNGGTFPGDTLRFITAGYVVGEEKMSDEILDAMLARIPKGDLPDGFPTSIVDVYPGGGEFFTWEGKPCGYEGLLSHSYHFLQAVPLRDPAIRERLYRPLKD